jgi:hypothetical protein
MRSIETSIEIQASATKVWQVLTDFESYPDWNPFVRQIQGTLAVGETLNVKVKSSEKGEMTFKPKVLNTEQDHEFRWKGHLLIPGIFDGEHAFTIEAVDEGHVRFLHSEKFTGILSPLIFGMLGKNFHKGFEQFNEALKVTSEATS